MTEADALAQLTAMTAAAVDPGLTDAELTQLVTLARRADRYFRFPTDPNWEPTYDLNAAAAVGWDWKAGKCSDRTDFRVGQDTFSREQVYNHCVERAEHYRAQAQPWSEQVITGNPYIWTPEAGPYTDFGYYGVIGN